MLSERVLVVGDSMLDRYWEGAVDRISPEAPVPVLLLRREWHRPGGAANVAANLAALGCPVTLVTLVGDDEAGELLADELGRNGVALRAVRGRSIATTQKIRAVCKQHQLLRLDVEQPPPPESVRALAQTAGELLPRHPWVLLSDYAKGSLGECGELVRRAAACGCRVLVDPKGSDYRRYAGAWLVKPNEAEARLAAGGWDDEAGFERRMAALRAATAVHHLLVTRGEHGASLFSGDGPPLHVSGERREVYDVSGAGDTMLAALAAALADGHALDDALTLANRAASVVVGKFGTATVRPEEIAGWAPPAQRMRRA